jgi:hypothetical protein
MIEGLDFTTLSVPTGIKARYVEAYMGASKEAPAQLGSSGVQLSAPSTLHQLQRAANAAAVAGKERAAFHVPAWSLRAMHARLDERMAAAKVGHSQAVRYASKRFSASGSALAIPASLQLNLTVQPAAMQPQIVEAGKMEAHDAELKRVLIKK